MGRYLNLDSAPVLSVSSIDAFTDAAGRAAALGFTDILVHWPRPDGVYAGDECGAGCRSPACSPTGT